MKIQKNAKYSYEAYGITEENGYIKWYNYEKIKKPIKFIGYALVAAMFVSVRIFKEELAAYGKANQVIVAFAALLTLIVAVVPLHEILHLLVMSKGRLDDKCIISLGKGSVSAVYNGYISKSRQIVCLLCPVAVFAVAFFTATMLTSGLLRLYFVYLLVMSCISSYTDIYMALYALRHIGKNDILFGGYKKSQFVFEKSKEM